MEEEDAHTVQLEIKHAGASRHRTLKELLKACCEPWMEITPPLTFPTVEFVSLLII